MAPVCTLAKMLDRLQRRKDAFLLLRYHSHAGRIRNRYLLEINIARNLVQSLTFFTNSKFCIQFATCDIELFLVILNGVKKILKCISNFGDNKNGSDTRVISVMIFRRDLFPFVNSELHCFLRCLLQCFINHFLLA